MPPLSLHHRRWRYRNLCFVILSIVIVYISFRIPSVQNLFTHVGDWGYIGAVLAGIFYVITFTTVPALAILYEFSHTLNLLELSILAGFGSVIGDFLIFSFLRKKHILDIEKLGERFHASPLYHLLHSRYFLWLTPVLGAIIIASPLPDELGISLLSASKLKKWQFILLTFVLDSVGIWLIISGTRLLFND